RPPARPGPSAASSAPACRTTPRTDSRRAPRASASSHASREASLPAELLFRGPDLPVDGGTIDRVVVAGQRARPRRDRVVVARELVEDVTVVILDDGVRLELVGRALQVVERLRQPVGLVVRPAEAVEVRAVAGLERQRLLQEIDGLVQPLA